MRYEFFYMFFKHSFNSNNNSKQMSIVSSGGILVNRDWMTNEAIYKLVLLLRISLGNENESITCTC